MFGKDVLRDDEPLRHRNFDGSGVGGGFLLVSAAAAAAVRNRHRVRARQRSHLSRLLHNHDHVLLRSIDSASVKRLRLRRQPRNQSDVGLYKVANTCVSPQSSITRRASFSPRRVRRDEQLTHRLRSLTSVLVHLHLSSSLSHIDAKIKLLNAYLERRRHHHYETLTFDQVKSSLARRCSSQTKQDQLAETSRRTVLLENSDRFRHLLLLSRTTSTPNRTPSHIASMINNRTAVGVNNDKSNERPESESNEVNIGVSVAIATSF